MAENTVDWFIMREKYCSLAEKVRPIEQGKDQQRDLESQSYQAVHAMNSPAPFRMQSKPSTEEPNRLVRKERRSAYIHCKMKKLTASTVDIVEAQSKYGFFWMESLF